MMIRSAALTSSISRNGGGLFDGVRCLVLSLLNEAGVEERVFGLRDEFTDVDMDSWRPAAVSAFDSIGPKSFGYCPSLVADLLAFEPDLTHTHGIWNYPSIATTVFSRKRNRPYVVSPHGMLDQWAVRNSRWKKRIALFLYEHAHLRKARCLRALCEQEARSFRGFGLKNDIAVIPNGVTLPKGSPPVCRPWNGAIEQGSKVLLFLGRIHPKKGLANLLKAWRQTGNFRSSAWTLAIAGWDQGGHEAELKRLATELDLAWTNGSGARRPASVIFLGPQFGDAKTACYHFADAFILPSLSEGLPMAVLEAWAHAKPALITQQCNLPQGFARGAALEIKSGADGIACGLNDLFETSQPHLEAMGERAAALVAEQFTWGTVAEQMKGLYLWILGGGPRPGCVTNF